MAVETLGDAWRLGWKLTARCAFGNRDGMKSIRECIYRAPLDMQTLVWTRGPIFPLSRLESRLMCPECGSRRVSVLFNVPKVPMAAGEARDGTIGRVQPAPATVTMPMRDIPRKPEPTTNPGACCLDAT
jgi:hypothetical protein